MTAGRPMPTQGDVLGYFDSLSNWGRWGDDDELGTLNHITDDVRVAAARAVRHGRSVSCGRGGGGRRGRGGGGGAARGGAPGEERVVRGGGRRTGRDGAVDDDLPARGRHAGCRTHAGRVPQ